MTVAQLRQSLRLHRLDRGWSYEQLAVAISAERVSAATVRRFIESETEPHDTTTYAVEKYLEQVAADAAQGAA
jgi:ribosome-binding protein aMBF1 (putative translation factor)